MLNGGAHGVLRGEGGVLVPDVVAWGRSEERRTCVGAIFLAAAPRSADVWQQHLLLCFSRRCRTGETAERPEQPGGSASSAGSHPRMCPRGHVQGVASGHARAKRESSFAKEWREIGILAPASVWAREYGGCEEALHGVGRLCSI